MFKTAGKRLLKEADISALDLESLVSRVTYYMTILDT